MKKWFGLVLGGLLLGTSLLTPVRSPLAARTPAAAGTGWLKAQSNGTTLPPGSAIALELSRNESSVDAGSSLDTVRDAARKALRAAGYRINRNSRYVLQIQIDLPTYAGGRDDRGDAETGPSTRLQPDVPRLADNWRVPVGRPSVETPSTIAVEMTLFERGGGVLWSATTHTAYNGSRQTAVILRMVKAAIAVIGSDAERNYVLGCTNDDRQASLCLD